MTREELVDLFDKHKEDISKLERNKKRIRDIDRIIEKIKKNTDAKITATYKEIPSGKTNTTSNTVADCVERKEEKILELEAEKKELEAENIILKSKVEDVEILLKSLKFKERKIIEEHYIEGNSYEDIGNRIYWEIYKQTRSGNAIQKIADKAINKMLKIL